MSKPSAVPAAFGFYLILLLAFCVSLFPGLSYYLAGGALVVWLFQLFIFRQTEFIASPLFYPIAGLAAFSLIVEFLSAIYSFENPVACVGAGSLFYFVALSFVPSREKRKMIIWTFLAGVILSVIVGFLAGMGALPHAFPLDIVLDSHLPVLVIISVCLIMAYYIEATGPREKVFFGLISLPLVIGLMNVDYAITVVAILVLVIAGLLKFRQVLLPAGLLIALAFSGLFGVKGEINEHIAKGLTFKDLAAPWNYIRENPGRLVQMSFYGTQEDAPVDETHTNRDPFLISLARHSGPPALLLFLWVFFELGRRDLIKIRKLAQREERAYHLATFFFIVILVAVNIYGSSLDCSPAILGMWMLFGMAEI